MTIVDSTSAVLLHADRERTQPGDLASDHEFSNYDSAIQPEYTNNFKKISFAGKGNRRIQVDLRQGRFSRALRACCALQFPRTFR
jgi:hypothetical protein